MGLGGATSKQKALFEDYDGFVEKFKPKLTTDDCYTPPLIFDTVKDWACAEYGIDSSKIVRPFYPGGDYESYDYPADCVVLDNPPFSILSKIVAFYMREGIRFFLFAPGLTAFSTLRKNDVTAVCIGVGIIYKNGANVNTSFLTNMDEHHAARTAPDLAAAVKQANEITQKQGKVELPKYVYPDDIVTAANLNRLSKYGIDLRIPKGACAFVSKLDHQNREGKAIFGGGLLLSESAAAEKAAAEKAAAEKAAATVWQLSDRERNIQRLLA